MKPLIIAIGITLALIVAITVITVPVVLLLPSDLSEASSSDASSESTTLTTPSPTPVMTGSYGNTRHAVVDYGTHGEYQQRERYTTDIRTWVTLYGGVL